MVYSLFLWTSSLSAVRLHSHACLISRANAEQIGQLTTYIIHKWPQRGDTFMIAELTFSIATFILLSTVNPFLAPFSPVMTMCLVAIVHLGGIVIFTVLYRISPFHPLAAYPGPFINKVTSLRLLMVVYSGKRHLIVTEWHERYGRFVRTGAFDWLS
jgi:hypothetical protein